MTGQVEQALLELLRPLVRQEVRREVERAKLQWRWQPVARAAELLGISEHAVRQRVLRGQLVGKKEHGRVYVDMEALDNRIEGRLR